MNIIVSFHKKLSVISLILFFFQGSSVAQNDSLTKMQQQNQKKDTEASTKAQSDIDLLVGLSQLIEKDKARLKNLQRDSSRLEPYFQQTSAQFYQADTQLDSVRNTAASPEELAITEHTWEQLRDVLDFLLERRRSVHQQIKILHRKIDKEQEAIDFILKGEMANIQDITTQQAMQAERGRLPSDSTRISDTTALENAVDLHQTDLTEYNWRVVGLKGKAGGWNISGVRSPPIASIPF